jgi:hypothetical protein
MFRILHEPERGRRVPVRLSGTRLPIPRVSFSGLPGFGDRAYHAKAAAATGGRDDLPGLDLETPAGAAYLRDLDWALDFARANRRSLEARALEVIGARTERGAW